MNTARALKKMLLESGIKIRDRSEAVKTQWINADERRARTAENAKKHFKDHWGTNSKRPEIAEKISISKRGDKNPMWGLRGPDNHAWLGGKKSWSKGRKMSASYRRWVFETLGNKCLRCGANELLTIHHEPPYRVCRSHDIKYLQILCEKCHFHGPNHLR